MKQTVIIFCMLGTGLAYGQATAVGNNMWDGGGEQKKFNKSLVAPANELEGITMIYKDGSATFNDIPETRRPIWAVVTNSAGEFVKQMRVTTEQNVMELHRLRNELYFVTIVYQGKSKKAFTIRP